MSAVYRRMRRKSRTGQSFLSTSVPQWFLYCDVNVAMVLAFEGSEKHLFFYLPG